LAQALAAPDVVEVLVNADGRIWLDRAGEGLASSDQWLSSAERETAIRLLAREAGDIVGPNRPALATTLPGASARIQALMPPLVEAPVLSIRKRSNRIHSLADYVEQGIATPEQADLLAGCIKSRRNIVVAGGAGSGKTTLVNALLAETAFAAARVLILEDTSELQCVSANCVRLLTKTTEPRIGMRELVQMSLRLRPDRIVVGEVRDGAALEVLKAWNTGHPGGLLTVHANSATDALTRLEDLSLEASASAPCRLIDAAVDVIVFVARTNAGRRISTIVDRRA
jgi:type IV secretion system protein VirB11